MRHRLVIWELILKTLLGSSNNVMSLKLLTFECFQNKLFLPQVPKRVFLVATFRNDRLQSEQFLTITKPIQISGILASQTNLENLEKLDLYNISTKC